MKCFPIKRLATGEALLNLACGASTHPQWNNLDFSLYAWFASRPRTAALLHRLGILSDLRYSRLRAVDPDIIRWDLRHGIPFSDSSFEAVYHSHFLEHLERRDAIQFLGECRRVLRPGGVLRIVVPDLCHLVQRYVSTLPPNNHNGEHDRAIADIFEQMVRRDSVGPNEQQGVVRFIEKLVRGSAGNIGESHRWMYDEHSLKAVLTPLGFGDFHTVEASISSIPLWRSFNLDTDQSGSPTKPGSLYFEARILDRN